MCCEAWHPKFNPWDLHKGGRRESAPQTYYMTYTHTSAHVLKKNFIEIELTCLNP